eukprot:338583-Amphidinium_carterae.2
MHGDEMRNLWMLRPACEVFMTREGLVVTSKQVVRYLKQKHIGKRIAARVVKHVEHKIEVSRNVVPESKAMTSAMHV